MSASRPANRLGRETSPYLLQHAHNPVDWYPWGEEALSRARGEDRPILLSIGYSACHWCHVMERESFLDEGIAAVMNQHFVSIKVDREERPDLDEIYMGAVQAMTGRGGWPLTVFLTPDLRPFYGGTYFPPRDRNGQPGLPRLLLAVAEHYRERRDRVEEAAVELMAALERSAGVLSPGPEPAGDLLDKACQALARRYDAEWGGFGGAPKFPHPMALAVLLRHHRHSGQPEPLAMVEHTLRQMARGGIYDQLGGGFHRYSVDAEWLTPHFEKMLYDNALLTWVLLEALQTTGRPLYRRLATHTLDYVLREMTLPGGGFCSTQDADSEGVEGRYYTWTPGEVRQLLPEPEADLFTLCYGVAEQGHLEDGRSILHVAAEPASLAAAVRADQGRVESTLSRIRARLLEARRQRVPPGRDDKVIASWNGLMISAMARASQVLDLHRYRQAAAQAAAFVLDELRDGDGLAHSWRDGHRGSGAFQDDYACLIHGLLDLYEATFELRWLRAARRLNREMLERFWDEREGGFFYTEEGAPGIVLRTKNPFDGAVPSGNSMGALALMRLAGLCGDPSLRERGGRILLLYGRLMAQAPESCAQMVCAMDFYQEKPYEVALIGGREEREELVRALHQGFVPNKVLMAADPAVAAAEAQSELPLLEGKVHPGGARAYVCRDFACSAPVSRGSELRRLLGSVR
ncbi:MAG: thioredoxin domain-containing protein [Candidatus Latescibacterota bacterium]